MAFPRVALVPETAPRWAFEAVTAGGGTLVPPSTPRPGLVDLQAGY